MLVVLLVISMSFSGLAVEEDEDPAVPFKSCYYLGDPAMVFCAEDGIELLCDTIYTMAGM